MKYIVLFIFKMYATSVYVIGVCLKYLLSVIWHFKINPKYNLYGWEDCKYKMTIKEHLHRDNIEKIFEDLWI